MSKSANRVVEPFLLPENNSSISLQHTSDTLRLRRKFPTVTKLTAVQPLLQIVAKGSASTEDGDGNDDNNNTQKNNNNNSYDRRSKSSVCP